jgi:hypothetical protein
MYIHFFFHFVVDIYVGFASASSNLAVSSYNSPRSTREYTDLLRTFHAFCYYNPVLPNILLAEEVGQCPLASSRQDIIAHRAGVRPLARQNILTYCIWRFLTVSLCLAKMSPVCASLWNMLHGVEPLLCQL